jgi:hypothetical protein
MKPFPAREVDAALPRKGFIKRHGDHAYYHFKYRGRRLRRRHFDEDLMARGRSDPA